MNEPRYIEVMGSALIRRPIDVHRATVKIVVTTRKTKTGLDLSLRLRDQVIAALQSVQLPADNIKDSGGSIGHSNWNAKKQLAHELKIEHKDMQVFANAMAAVEHVFTEAKTGSFSGISSDFSFVIDEPIYARNEGANEKGLKDAVAHATKKAALFAEAASVQLGPIYQITELVRPSHRKSNYEREDHMDFDAHFGFSGMSEFSDDYSVDYTPVSPKEAARLVQVRVRFGVSYA